MYKISEFSKITNLSVKALRYYDEQDILRPSLRAENGYRYYDRNDFHRAQTVSFLKEMEFSIKEIKDVLAQDVTAEDLPYFLMEKHNQISSRIAQEKALLKKLELHIKQQNEQTSSYPHVIEVKTITKTEVASLRFQGKYSDMGIYLKKIYQEIKGAAGGVPFNCYYDSEFKEYADMELCVPLKKSIYSSHMTMKTLPEIQAVCTTHTGPYSTLNYAYKDLLDYAQEHQLTYLIPSREMYHKGPGMLLKGNPNSYVTEIIIPIHIKS